MYGLFTPIAALIAKRDAFLTQHSLRFDGANDYLLGPSLSTGSTNSRRTYTISAWVRLDKQPTGTVDVLTSTYYPNPTNQQIGLVITSGLDVRWFEFDSDTGDYLTGYPGDYRTSTSPISVGGWHHVVCQVDTTAASSADRVKIWVDGSAETLTETAAYSSNYITLTSVGTWPNTSVAQKLSVGASFNQATSAVTRPLPGQLAEIYFIDGTAYDQTYFGETRGGVWLPKQVTDVTYGNNGFYLDFSQPPSTTNAFNAVTYTGSASDQDVTVGFQPDFAWIKCRNETISHSVWDSVRGADKLLASDTTAAETTLADTVVTDADGMTLYGGYSRINSSTNSRTYVAWCWKAGGSSNTYNIDDVGYSTASAAGLDVGSITPTGASVNTAAGFSIIKYTGNGSTASVSHGLNETPECIIVKNLNTSATSWSVWHDGYGDNNYQTLYLDGTGNLSSLNRTRISGVSNQTFSLANHVEVTGNTDGHIAYCWHSVEGYSKIGSYVGNSSSNGPIIKTGFRPAFIMIKNTTTGSIDDWHILDNARDFANPISYRLKANLSAIESSTDPGVAFLADGFQLLDTSGARNTSNNTYIYMAFADTSPNLGVDRTTDGTGVTLLLDGTSTTDKSSAGNNVTLTGATANDTTVTDQFGGSTGSFKFDAAGEYITVPDAAVDDWGTDDWTIEFWVKPTSTASRQILCGSTPSNGDTADSHLMIDLDSTGYWDVYVGDGTSWTQINGTIAATTSWQHVAAVRNGQTVSLFVDGAFGGSVTVTHGVARGTATPFRIGRTGDYTLTDFAGYIADFRITRGYARYTDSFTPPTSALSADVSGITGSDDVVLLLDGSGGGNATVSDGSSINNTVTNVSSGVSNSNITGPYGTTQDVLSFDGVDDTLNFDVSTAMELDGDFTIETWIKRGNTAVDSSIFNYWGTSSDPRFNLRLDRTDGNVTFSYQDGATLHHRNFSYGTGSADGTTDWFHLALTRNGTSLRCFIDGVQIGTTQTISTATFTGSTTYSNKGYIGSLAGVENWFNGQIADVRITKGAALYPFYPPISALTNDDTWDKPKNDFSVEGNITPDDQLLDTPNLRFATLDASNLSDANLTTQNLGTNTGVRANSHGQKSSGKWYWETSLVDTSPSGNHTGVWDISETMGANYVGQTSGSWGLYLGLGATLPRVRHNGTYTEPSGVTAFASGDIISIAIDLDSGKMWYAKNGVWFESGNPSAGTGDAYDVATNPSKALTGTLAPADIQRDTMTYNFGQDHTFAGKKSALVTPYSDAKGNGEFYYQPPSGFLALATAYK